MENLSNSKKNKSHNSTSESTDHSKKSKKDKSDKSEKSDKSTGKKDKKKKGKNNQIRTKEEKQAYIKHLKHQIQDINKQFVAVKKAMNAESCPTYILQQEVENLRSDQINMRFQCQQVEDRYNAILAQYEKCQELLENSHTEQMNQEELIYLKKLVGSKTDLLLERRDYLKKLKKGDWRRMAPKVANDCQETLASLDFEQTQIANLKKEYAECMKVLNETRQRRNAMINDYRMMKVQNLDLGLEMQDLHEDINLFAEFISTKKREAKELKTTIESVKDIIEKAKLEQEEMAKKSEEAALKISEERQLRREKRLQNNLEIQNLQEEYNKKFKERKTLQTKLKNVGREIKKKKQEIKKMPSENLLVDLRNDHAELLKEVNELQKNLSEETKLKNSYLVILEEMLGHTTIFVRIRPEDNESYTKFFSQDQIVIGNQYFTLDHIIGSDVMNDNMFANFEHVYQRVFDGFNCSFILIGSENAGKTHTLIGDKENGLIYKGIAKLKDLQRESRQSQLNVKFQTTALILGENTAYDLNTEKSVAFDIKHDHFSHTLFKYMKYIDSSDIEDIKKSVTKAISKRKNGEKELNLSRKEVCLVIIITVQVHNKFKHRFSKGKINHIILADPTSVKSLKSAMDSLSKGGKMPKDTRMNTFLAESFGGSAKNNVIGCMSSSKKGESNALQVMKYIEFLQKIICIPIKVNEPERIYEVKHNIERLLRGVKEERIL